MRIEYYKLGDNIILNFVVYLCLVINLLVLLIYLNYNFDNVRIST